MTLTDKHITYENDCRQMFVGQTIRAVIYGEVKYFADEDGNNGLPLVITYKVAVKIVFVFLSQVVDEAGQFPCERIQIMNRFFHICRYAL